MLYSTTKKWLFVFVCIACSCMEISANDSIPESKPRPRPAIIDSILFTTDTANVPMVSINQSAKIEALISDKIAGNTERQTTNIHGYRVQVFSSNTQRTAKGEAFKIEKRISAKFPDIDIYVQYQPPFWKVRLGNFRSVDEAAILRDELIRQFPEIQGDIYTVKDFIQVPE